MSGRSMYIVKQSLLGSNHMTNSVMLYTVTHLRLN